MLERWDDRALTSLNVDIWNAYNHHQACMMVAGQLFGRAPLGDEKIPRRRKVGVQGLSTRRIRMRAVRIAACGRPVGRGRGTVCRRRAACRLCENRGVSARSAHRHGTVFIRGRQR